MQNAPSFNAGLPLLLTDGTVLVQDADASDWWKLVPDATGNYVDGTWTEVASTPSTYGPLYYASAVLADGRVVVIGGEYNLAQNTETSIGYIYDPVKNTWTFLPAPTGWPAVGDDQCVVLPDGTFMLANPNTTQSAVLNPTSLAWTMVGSGKIDSNANESWILLPDGSVFCVDIAKNPATERYLPTQGSWIGAGSPPVKIESNDQTGTQVLMPNGKVFMDGPTGNTVIYTPPTTLTGLGSFVAGPTFPKVSGNQLTVSDAPAALLPNGNVLCMASTESAGTKFFEFDGTNLNATGGTVDAPFHVTMPFNFLLLPNGQVLSTMQSTDVEVYSSTGTPQSAWKPTITGVSSQVNVGGTYSLSGTQFNGLSQGTTYGDDSSNATNYPIVKITNNATGHVFYSRTHGHSTMAVATGTTPTTTNFDVPTSAETGASMIQVVANGIASNGTPIYVINTLDTINGLSFSPNNVLGGKTSTGTVNLGVPAPAGGWTVTLKSQIPSYVTVPASITIPAGATSGTFQIATQPFRQTYTNVITATDTTNHTTGTLTVIDDSITTVSLNPSSVMGGASSTGTVNLLQAAPVGGWTINLTSQIPSYVSVPASISIPEGATSGTFAITTKLFRQNYSNIITATDDTNHMTSTLTVTDDSISALTLSPSTVPGGTSSTATLTLLQAAPTGGWTVNLKSQIPSYVSVPSSVTIAAGATSTTFPVATTKFRQNYSNIITATDATSTKAATLTITGDSISTLTLSPSTVPGGTSSTATLTLLQAAPAGGWTVNLTSQIPSYVSVPASVTIAAGASSTTFTVTTKAFRQNYSNTITATDTNSTKTTTLSITGDSIANFSISPTSVVGGTSSTGTITLANAAPSDWTINLTSQIPSYVGVPATITIPAGSTVGTFTITTKTFRQTYTNTITAADTASSLKQTLTITTS